MQFRWVSVSIIGALLLALASAVRAGGPFIFADDGTIVKWPTGPSGTSVTLTLDQDGLGMLSNSQAHNLVSDVITVWNGVPQSTLNLQIAPNPLSADVTVANYQQFLNQVLHGFNPVVYDTDGSIVDALSGSRNQIVGVAMPVFYVDLGTTHPAAGNILEGRVILNGRFIDGITTPSNPEVTQEEFKGVAIHETGHMLGLDHAQINFAYPDAQPTMFPIVHPGIDTLKMDDIGWISYLYPSSLFNSSFGSISGSIVQLIGGTAYQGCQGINVVARLIGGGLVNASSCVSGYRYRAGFSPAGRAGSYIIPGLPPGNYSVEVERIYDGFAGGSSVGPLEWPVDFPIGQVKAVPEFYNGTNESAWDNPSDMTPVTVTAGNQTTGIDIILNTLIPLSTARRSWTLYR